jgi:3'-5' exoribonuclease
MTPQKTLNLLKKGDPVNHYLLIRKSEIKVAKNNKEYWALEIGDQSTSLNAKMWERFDKCAKSVKVGDVIKVEGKIDDFLGNLQISISSVRPCTDDDNVSPNDFLPRSIHDPEQMKQTLINRITTIRNNSLKTLMWEILTEDRLKKFIASPAGKYWHHSYMHGLIEHTLEIIRICDLMCDIHPEINRDILICGAILHDFGKIEELAISTSIEYTDKGKLLGHIVISAMLVNETAKRIDNFPDDLKDCLIHLILAHQGKLEFASPVVPKTLEAITLYQADELSAKVNAYKNALAAVDKKSDNKWTKFITLIATDLFSHNLPEEVEEVINKTLFDNEQAAPTN